MDKHKAIHGDDNQGHHLLMAKEQSDQKKKIGGTRSLKRNK